VWIKESGDCVQVFSTVGDGNGVQRDAVNEAWEWRCKAHDEGYDGAPVGSVARRVAVYTVEIVHVGHGNIATACNVVAR